MRRKLFWVTLFGAAIGVAAMLYVAKVSATAASGFKATPLAVGTFAEIDVFNQSPKNDLPAGNDDNVWLSIQKTKGRSDLWVLSNTWPAVNTNTTPPTIATTGWHTHPGHSLIIVTSGSITDYMADCMPHVYTVVPGQPLPTLVDPGSDHVHVIRNEGSVPASTITVQLIPYDPAKGNRRIDAPAPETCSNIH